MDTILRFEGASRHDEAIDVWLSQRPPELGAIARTWFTRMRQCGDDVRELLHDGCPTVCLGDAPFAYVSAFTSHVNVGFFQGAALDDPAGLLEGAGRFMRHVKLRPGVPADQARLEALIDAAYADMKLRIAEL
jgi:hypothetical protein